MSNIMMAQKLLKTLALAHIFIGFLLLLVYFVKPLHDLLLSLLYADRILPDKQQIIFWVSIFGPTIASWGLLYFQLLKNYFENPNPKQHKILIYALLVWAPFDSLLCWMNGLYLGMVLNTLVLILFLILLYQVRPKNKLV